MFRLKSVAILLTLAPVCAFAQRHSGDSEQGYYQRADVTSVVPHSSTMSADINSDGP
jgi:hypothetical protein